MCRKEKNSLSNPHNFRTLPEGREVPPLPRRRACWKADRIASASIYTIYPLLWAREGCIPRARRVGGSILASSWSFRGNVYTQYHWDFTILSSNALTSEIYTWKGLVRERTVTFSYSIFSQINVFLLFPLSFILFLAPPFFINILYFPLLLCFSKLKRKPINKAFTSSSLMPAF